MKLTRLMLVLLFVLNATQAFSQKYHISSPPIDGYFYVDTAKCNQQTLCRRSNKCVNIVSDNKTVSSSGKGYVLYCYPHADKTSEIAIKYGSVIIVYANILNRKVFKGQAIAKEFAIGELLLNPKDKKYHLGLQVVKSENPNEILWGNKLAQFLNANTSLLVDASE